MTLAVALDWMGCYCLDSEERSSAGISEDFSDGLLHRSMSMLEEELLSTSYLLSIVADRFYKELSKPSIRRGFKLVAASTGNTPPVNYVTGFIYYFCRGSAVSNFALKLANACYLSALFYYAFNLIYAIA